MLNLFDHIHVSPATPSKPNGVIVHTTGSGPAGRPRRRDSLLDTDMA
jgi:hypothetical protein